jgi:hypothetical protein
LNCMPTDLAHWDGSRPKAISGGPHVTSMEEPGKHALDLD